MLYQYLYKNHEHSHCALQCEMIRIMLYSRSVILLNLFPYSHDSTVTPLFSIAFIEIAVLITVQCSR